MTEIYPICQIEDQTNNNCNNCSKPIENELEIKPCECNIVYHNKCLIDKIKDNKIKCDTCNTNYNINIQYSATQCCSKIFTIKRIINTLFMLGTIFLFVGYNYSMDNKANKIMFNNNVSIYEKQCNNTNNNTENCKKLSHLSNLDQEFFLMGMLGGIIGFFGIVLFILNVVFFIKDFKHEFFNTTSIILSGIYSYLGFCQMFGNIWIFIRIGATTFNIGSVNIGQFIILAASASFFIVYLLLYGFIYAIKRGFKYIKRKAMIITIDEQV